MPIMLGISRTWSKSIPFSMLSEKQAITNHGQTLKRLSERGGLSPDEAVALIRETSWKRIPDDVGLWILNRHLVARQAD